MPPGRREFLRMASLLGTGYAAMQVLTKCGIELPPPQPTPDNRLYGAYYETYLREIQGHQEHLPTGETILIPPFPYADFEGLVTVTQAEPFGIFNPSVTGPVLEGQPTISISTPTDEINRVIGTYFEKVPVTELPQVSIASHTVYPAHEPTLTVAYDPTALEGMLTWIHTTPALQSYLVTHPIAQYLILTARPTNPIFPSAKAGFTIVGTQEGGSGTILAYTFINIPTLYGTGETLAETILVEATQAALDQDRFNTPGDVFGITTSSQTESLANGAGLAYRYAREAVAAPATPTGFIVPLPQREERGMFADVRRIYPHTMALPNIQPPRNFLAALIGGTSL